MATLIPPTANFDGRIEQPSTELEYSCGEEGNFKNLTNKILKKILGN